MFQAYIGTAEYHLDCNYSLHQELQRQNQPNWA